MSQTNSSSQVTLFDNEKQREKCVVFGCYLINSSKISDLECAGVPEKKPQAAHTTEFKQAYKSYEFHIKGVRQNEECLPVDVTEDALKYILAAGDEHC